MLFVTCVVALCGILSVFIISQVISSQLQAKYEVDQKESVEFLSTSLASMVALEDHPRIERTIESVLVYENIVSVAVYDAEGALIRSTTELGEAATVSDSIIREMTQDDVSVGHVEIGFSRLYIEQQVRRLTAILALAITGFLVITAIALIWYMGRSVVQPLRAFTQTVQTMSATNLSARVPVVSEDEIGLLSRSFNAMANELELSQQRLSEAHRQLEQRYSERALKEERRAEQVRRIFDLRQQLNTIGDVPTLMGYVTSSLQQAFDYFGVNVFLADSATGGLRLVAGAGDYAGKVPLGRAIHAGDGIVGQVLQSCQPRLVGDVKREPRFIEMAELADTKAELAVPINIGAVTLGVLDIQCNKEDGLDEMDLFTAQAVADQLANVLENDRLAEETRELTILEERNRMAREIHDTLAQGFTGIVLQMEAAEQVLHEDPASVSRHIDRARSLARASLNEARRSVWALRPEALEKQALAEAIRREAEALTEEGQVVVEFSVSGKQGRLASEVEDALLRICQECFANIRKHSGASTAKVNLSFGKTTIALHVQDNGSGFDTSKSHKDSFGLIGMNERARQCGGTATVTSEHEKGTTVEVSIPTSRRHHDD
ncbi:MAG: HAMP domain-containing protein [Dehalococcoidia bacterium]|nr:HAMP domain-containing protein [Dehalococcoidia bacterium]